MCVCVCVCALVCDRSTHFVETNLRTLSPTHQTLQESCTLARSEGRDRLGSCGSQLLLAIKLCVVCIPVPLSCRERLLRQQQRWQQPRQHHPSSHHSAGPSSSVQPQMVSTRMDTVTKLCVVLFYELSSVDVCG